MAMNLQDGTDHNGLFDLQGKAFAAAESLNTYAGTTLPALFDSIVAAFEAATGYPLSFQSAIQGLPTALTSWQSSGQTLESSIKTYAGNILAEMVADETTLLQNTLVNQIDYLIGVMVDGAYYVTPSVVAGTLTTGAANVGDTSFTWTLSNASGVAEQNAYAETLTATVAARPSATTPAIGILGTASVSTMSATWPQGSGANYSLQTTSPANSLLTNGNFSAATLANIPDNWIIAVGTPGTTVKLTAPEQQTIAISGTPSAGTYLLYWTDPSGNQWATQPLVYNASASEVQTALRLIPGLSLATVTATGTSPNYTHTFVFTGVGGDVAELTSVNLTTGGTITHATTVAGVAGDYRGYTVEMVGNSSVLHTIYAPTSRLVPGKVYACHFRIRRTGTATSAAATVGIVQEIGGTVLNDPAGTANSLAVNLQTVSASAHESKWFTFRLPATALAPVYLRFAVTTAIPTGASIFLADVAIAEMNQVYPGGPFVAAFSGKLPSLADDYWTLAVTNDRAGEWQTWYHRAFGTAANEQYLPTTGTTLIDNALIA
jgi:hypothetical protein